MADLFLDSASLLSKWGFGDGDIPDHILDLLEAAGHDPEGVPPGQEDNAPPTRWHHTLRRLVREHLLPALNQHVEVVDVDTIHNPIRAVAVDGVEPRRCGPEAKLTPERVAIPLATVLRVYFEEERRRG